MRRLTRGEFVGFGAAWAAGVVLPKGAGAESTMAPVPSGTGSSAGTVMGSRGAAQANADLIVTNARIYTVDGMRPKAVELAVKGDRFVALGGARELGGLAGPDTEILDAAGMTVVPGFIDAHSHPGWGGINELTQVNLDLRSIREIQDALRLRAEATPEGEWILGFKYDDTKVVDGRQLHRRDLDEAVPDHPVLVRHRGGHTTWVNSRALGLAGVTNSTPDPEHGRFFREDGELTGRVAERANDVFSPFMPDDTTREQRQVVIKLMTALMTAAGLTSVHDAGVGADFATAYQDAYAAGELSCRIYMLLRGGIYETFKATGLYTGFGDDWFRIGAVKYGADGSASERTMRMSTPYVGRPDDYGILTMSQEQIHEVVEAAHCGRFQVGIHANGDVAIDMVLNAYERVQRLWPRPDPRHRLEHCSLINDDLLARIKAVGAIPTPSYTYVHYHGNKWLEYGQEKMRSMFAHRSFLDTGIPVAGASDYIPGPYEPLMAIQSMVTRKDFDGRVWGPNQRITVDEALRICTVDGAHASFEENTKGSISPGKLADFVVLEEDPHDVDPDRIKEIGVARTVIGGRTVHAA